MTNSIDPIVNKYINEAEKFSKFQEYMLADFANSSRSNVKTLNDVLKGSLYMWRLGGKNKESDDELLKDLRYLVDNDYFELKNNSFRLTSKGQKTDVVKRIHQRIMQDYGGKSGRWTGD